MASRREVRIAQNQALFRIVNERVTAWPERQAAPPTEKLMFYCECGDEHCYERVYLTPEEYEAIRADSSRFAVVEGHVFPDAEDVVAERNGYDVVEKHKELRDITERTDPRKGADPQVPARAIARADFSTGAGGSVVRA
jgi:hypothetical protein